MFGFNLSKNFSKNDVSRNITVNFKEFIDCNSKTDLEIRNICNSFAIDIAIDLNGYTKMEDHQFSKTGVHLFK